MHPGYVVSVADARSHFFQIGLSARKEGDRTVLRMPAWIPGSYMIRDFARQVRGMLATAHLPGKGKTAGGQRTAPLTITELDKDSWSVDTSALPEHCRIEVSYEVYAFDRSVRTAYLDQERAFFNASSLLLAVQGQEHEPCELVVLPVAGIKGAKAASGLPIVKVDKNGFGQYRARNYDELIDCPFEIANFQEFNFNTGGARHRFVVSGRHDGDLDRLAADVQRICETQCSFFEPQNGKAPFNDYVFMLNVLGSGYGGLEHRNSTALICSSNDLVPDGGGYETLLGLISHEYFHSWNVKRIKPQAFSPYQLDRENYTRLLWIFEGFTSYYDDLLILRSGVFGREQYLRALAKTVTQVLNSPGRKHQSLEASSFLSWTKYYKQDENSPNSIISYYTKGALVALCLDLSIRHQTRHRKSLDDVMRLLWTRFGKDFDRNGTGLSETGFAQVVLDACGVDVSTQLRAWTQETDELPLDDLLEPFGLRLKNTPVDTLENLLGAKFRAAGGGLEMTQVRTASAAEHAGLAAGDVLMACNERRVQEESLRRALLDLGKERPKGRAAPELRLLAFRSDSLIELRLGAPRNTGLRYSLEAVSKPGRTRAAALIAWLDSH